MIPYDITHPHCVKNIGEQWVSIVSNDSIMMIYIVIGMIGIAAKVYTYIFNIPWQYIWSGLWRLVLDYFRDHFVYGLSQWENDVTM